MSKDPQLLFVAGPNGAGKSTFSKELSQPWAIIFDVDKVIPRIEAELPNMAKKMVYDASNQEFFNQAIDAIKQRQHFTLETNFRDNFLMDVVAEFKCYGYTTNMVYLTLDNIEQSAYRVNKRVLDGGHFVDLKNIQLNYEVGLQCLGRFADQFDNLDIVDASKRFDTLRSLLKIENQQFVYLSENLPVSVEQKVKDIAELYRNNSRGYI